MLIDLARCEDLFHTPLCRHRDRRTPRNLARRSKRFRIIRTMFRTVLLFLCSSPQRMRCAQPRSPRAQSWLIFSRPSALHVCSFFSAASASLKINTLELLYPPFPWNHTTNRTWEVLTNKGGGWFSRMWRSQLRSLVRAGRPAAPPKWNAARSYRWKASLLRLCRAIIDQFYSPAERLFFLSDNWPADRALATPGTDFGHNAKALDACLRRRQTYPMA
jgi:hypothetical protein